MPYAWSAVAPRECRCATEINVDLPQHWPRIHCFSAHCVPLGYLRDDLFADDLDGTQDMLLSGHDEAQ
jgi:hypothetical protein